MAFKSMNSNRNNDATRNQKIFASVILLLAPFGAVKLWEMGSDYLRFRNPDILDSNCENVEATALICENGGVTVFIPSKG